MFARILGFLDVLAVAVLLLSWLLPAGLISFIAVAVLFKGLFFAMLGNRISYLDALSGLYLILVSHGWSHWLPSLLTGLFLGQKGLASMF